MNYKKTWWLLIKTTLLTSTAKQYKTPNPASIMIHVMYSPHSTTVCQVRRLRSEHAMPLQLLHVIYINAMEITHCETD